MQADTAVVPEIIEETYPFSTLRNGANVLIFPNLEAGNIVYKLLARLGGATAIGPILMGLSKPVHVLQRGCEVDDIVNMTAIAVVDAQEDSPRSFEDLLKVWADGSKEIREAKPVRRVA
jgi:malate dehydrogenase (oxaloacetate-decarboxylating)(NADP+)